mmetsp:Transcript_25788/g.70864  ORF Transcript_25788/g.70864 Transcript_25788/m.70864 type:complete len:93 (-) Transcript_25788:108-386(-)
MDNTFDECDKGNTDTVKTDGCRCSTIFSSGVAIERRDDREDLAPLPMGSLVVDDSAVRLSANMVDRFLNLITCCLRGLEANKNKILVNWMLG